MNRRHRTLTWSLGWVLAIPAIAAEEDVAGEKAFWRAIVENGYEVPDGADPYDLLLRLFDQLGSTDPVLRDDYGYGITARWVYRDRRLDEVEAWGLTQDLLARLRVGIGEQGTDSVLMRSFAALDLSLFAAFDLEDSFLDREQFQTLLDGALDYLAAERDVRGFDADRGWMHSVAHTADLLKFLARNPLLDVADQERIALAIADKIAAADVIFQFGEDERLARALLSILSREDCSEAVIESLVSALEKAKRREPSAVAFDPEQHRVRQNGVNLLRALHVLLSLQRDPAPAMAHAKATLLRCLATY